MIEIAILEAGKRDGVSKLQGRSVLSFGGAPGQKQEYQRDRLG
jgi:hypothetical protein